MISRDLLKEAIIFLFINGVNFKMHVGDSVDNVPGLALLELTKNGFKTVIELQSGNKKSTSSWREFFNDFKHIGLITNSGVWSHGWIAGAGIRLQRNIYFRQDSTMPGL